jgi:hypothetical protein
MKTKMTMFFASVFLIAACELVKDAAEVNLTTQLSTNIAIVVAGSKSVEITPEAKASGFSKSQVLYLKDNTEIEPYLKKIREINLKRVLVDIYGLTEGQVVNTLSLDVEGAGTIATITNITPMNIAYSPVIDEAKLVQAGKKLAKDLKITLIVHGDANGPMSFNINMAFDVDVVAGALD